MKIFKPIVSQNPLRILSLTGLLLILTIPATLQAEPLIAIRIPEPLDAETRAKKYEDPINDYLKSQSQGKVIEGGMATNAKTGEISYITVNAEVFNIDQAFPALRKFVKDMGVPAETTFVLTYSDGHVVEAPLVEKVVEDHSSLIIIGVYGLILVGGVSAVLFYLSKRKKALASMTDRERELLAKKNVPPPKLY